VTEFLSPDQYDRAEQRGTEALPCRAIEFFRPTTFAEVGYPVRIRSIAELWKYTECMHDGIGLTERMDKYLMSNLLAGGFTDQELNETRIVKEALDDIGRAAGRPVEYPSSSMILAFNQARHISCVVPPGSTIVELGGGAGYLGALLTLRGYRYIATDVTQVFYILQSQLIGRLSRTRLVDLVDPDLGPSDLASLEPGQAALVPWWRWAQREIPSAVSIDLATTNHNLLEMHPFCRLYHLSVVRDSLSADAVGFVFEGWGSPIRNPRWTAVKDFWDLGFELAHNDTRATCFVPKNAHAADSVVQYPLPPAASAERPSVPDPLNEAIGAPSVWRRALSSALRRAVGVDLTKRLGETFERIEELWTKVDVSQRNPYEVHFAAPEFSSVRNSVSRAILEMRRQERETAHFTLDDYARCFGTTDLATEDDRFLAYIFRDTPLAQRSASERPMR